jgi:heptaprenyl diphosphate synthase
MDEARATLQGYADRARETLRDLPDAPARRALAALTETVIDRTG